MDYGFTREVNMGFEEAVAGLKTALQEQGFGILTEINIRKTLKEKLGIDGEDYIILGACNPSLAHHALKRERNLGLLLPCNAVVYCHRGKTVVGVVSPKKMLQVTGNPVLEEFAVHVEEKMKMVIERVGKVNE